jgi:hypothetical protein
MNASSAKNSTIPGHQYLNIGLAPYIFLPWTRAFVLQFKRQQYQNLSLAPHIYILATGQSMRVALQKKWMIDNHYIQPV